jgi:hypothetical protein
MQLPETVALGAALSGLDAVTVTVTVAPATAIAGLAATVTLVAGAATWA